MRLTRPKNANVAWEQTSTGVKQHQQSASLNTTPSTAPLPVQHVGDASAYLDINTAQGDPFDISLFGVSPNTITTDSKPLLSSKGRGRVEVEKHKAEKEARRQAKVAEARKKNASLQKDYSPLRPSPLIEEVVLCEESRTLKSVSHEMVRSGIVATDDEEEVHDLERMLEEALREEAEREAKTDASVSVKIKSPKRYITEDTDERANLARKKQCVQQISTSSDSKMQQPASQSSASCERDDSPEDEQPTGKPGKRVKGKVTSQVEASKKRKRSTIGDADDEEARYRSNRIRMENVEQIKLDDTKRKHEEGENCTTGQEHIAKRRFVEDENATKSTGDGRKRKRNDDDDSSVAKEQPSKKRFCKEEKRAPGKTKAKKRKFSHIEDATKDSEESAKRRFAEETMATPVGAKRAREEAGDLPIAKRRFAESGCEGSRAEDRYGTSRKRGGNI